MTSKIYLEFREHRIDEKKIEAKIKEIWKLKGNMVKDIETMEIYFKAEEGMCYYVINNAERGGFALGMLDE